MRPGALHSDRLIATHVIPSIESLSVSVCVYLFMALCVTYRHTCSRGVQLNPAEPDVLPVLTTVLAEIGGLFPDVEMHLGFDEINQKCWYDWLYLLLLLLLLLILLFYYYVYYYVNYYVIGLHNPGWLMALTRLDDARFQEYITKNNLTIGQALQRYFIQMRTTLAQIMPGKQFVYWEEAALQNPALPLAATGGVLSDLRCSTYFVSV